VDREGEFDDFVHRVGRRLWQALVPVAGPESAHDALAEAFLYAWQHWDRVRAMDNPEGYLYVVARRQALRRSPTGLLPATEAMRIPHVEPGLVSALAELTEMQRQVVYLVDGLGWGLTDVARLLEISVSTVRNHQARALARLRNRLKVETDV
jgi:DNA-directed RNA polymerase specialized sigma24 family protein